MSTWHTLESARGQWADAPLDDESLSELLEVAKVAVLAYAPVLTSTAPEPVDVTDADVTVTFSGVADQVTAAVVAGAGSAATILVPEVFRPIGYPEYNVDLNNRAYFSIGNPALLDVVTNAAQAFTMYWTAAAPTDVLDIPVSYRSAQLMQARNVWNSGQASPSGGDGFDNIGFGLTTTHPLDWQIKQLLRPRSVFGGVVG